MNDGILSGLDGLVTVNQVHCCKCHAYHNQSLHVKRIGQTLIKYWYEPPPPGLAGKSPLLGTDVGRWTRPRLRTWLRRQSGTATGTSTEPATMAMRRRLERESGMWYCSPSILLHNSNLIPKQACYQCRGLHTWGAICHYQVVEHLSRQGACGVSMQAVPEWHGTGLCGSLPNPLSNCTKG